MVSVVQVVICLDDFWGMMVFMLRQRFFCLYYVLLVGWCVVIQWVCQVVNCRWLFVCYCCQVVVVVGFFYYFFVRCLVKVVVLQCLWNSFFFIRCGIICLRNSCSELIEFFGVVMKLFMVLVLVQLMICLMVLFIVLMICQCVVEIILGCSSNWFRCNVLCLIRCCSRLVWVWLLGLVIGGGRLVVEIGWFSGQLLRLRLSICLIVVNLCVWFRCVWVCMKIFCVFLWFFVRYRLKFGSRCMLCGE